MSKLDNIRLLCIFVSKSRSMIDYTQYITLHPDQRSGKPCIRGMRITVYDVLSYLAAGDTTDIILEHFPMLTREDILACLAYAADAEGRFRLSA